MTCDNTHSIVVIGNGPSAIFMSYVLSGNIPYYDRESYGPVPDQRLDVLLEPYIFEKNTKNKSLVDAIIDKELINYIANGYQSFYSSMLPENLLMDVLVAVDESGFISPDMKQSRIKWIYQPQQAIDHIVLGSSSQPGGQWWGRNPDSSQDKSLSYGEMLSFPTYPFSDFYKESTGHIVSDFYRPTRDEVANYYAQFVSRVGISGNFHNSTVVNYVDKSFDHKIVVCAVDKVTGIEKSYFADFAILATGIFEKPMHTSKQSSFDEVSRLVTSDNITSQPESLSVTPPLCTPPCEDPSTHSPCPILVIGSGVSAADVINDNASKNSIIHIYKWNAINNQCPLRKFDQELYPEYYSVYSKMKSSAEKKNQFDHDFSGSLKNFTIGRSHEYEGIANAVVTGLSPDGIVDIKLPNGNTLIRRVRKIELRVGRSGSLDYLSPRIIKQRGPATKETFRTYINQRKISDGGPFCLTKNVFIIGSLCGDTLVRFLHGSCLRVRKDIEDTVIA